MTTTINKSNLFKQAHKLAKTYTGNYKACFALALKTLFKQAHAIVKTIKSRKSHRDLFIEALNKICEAVKPSVKPLKKVYIEGEDEYRELSIMEAVKDEYVTADEVKEILAGGKSKQIWYTTRIIIKRNIFKYLYDGF